MSDFTLAYESCEAVRDYAVLISEMENGSEQRRLKHSEVLVGWKFRSPALTSAQALVYQQFLDGKFGATTEFTWTYPMDGVEYTVRFVPGSFKVTHSEAYCRIEWSFQRVI